MEGARRLEDQVRVGLNSNDDQIQPERKMRLRKVCDPLDVVSFGKPVRRHVRDFGALFCLLGCVVSVWKLYNLAPLYQAGAWLSGGLLFWTLGRYAPKVLLPLWRGWMKIAHCLSVVMTFVLLSVTWCVGFIPMSLLLRCCGIKRMDVSFKDGATSYWEERDPKYDDFKRMELQY